MATKEKQLVCTHRTEQAVGARRDYLCRDLEQSPVTLRVDLKSAVDVKKLNGAQ